jgi:transcription antitermination factor NusG
MQEHWYALYVRLRREQLVATILQNKGYHVFLPTFPSTRRWSDRVKQIQRPLFPGYVFCHMSLDDRRAPIVTTPGVVGFVGNGGGPAAIPRSEIEAVQKICDSNLPLKQWPEVTPGCIVRIGYGPLAGIEGTLVTINKQLQLVVSIVLLQRAVSVRIAPEWVIAARRLPAHLPLGAHGSRRSDNGCGK